MFDSEFTSAILSEVSRVMALFCLTLGVLFYLSFATSWLVVF